MGLSFWTFSVNHSHILHGHVIWVSGCGVPLPYGQAASSPGDLVSWLPPWWWHRTSSGSQPGHCVTGDADQRTLRPEIRLHGAQRSGRTNYTLCPWRWWETRWERGRTGAYWICTKWYGILWWKRFHICPLRMISHRGNRWMAPPQASPYPMWPVSLVIHLLVWHVQYSVYTWGWDQALKAQRYHFISCGPKWNNHNR